jgi:hypothetical protein
LRSFQALGILPQHNSYELRRTESRMMSLFFSSSATLRVASNWQSSRAHLSHCVSHSRYSESRRSMMARADQTANASNETAYVCSVLRAWPPHKASVLAPRSPGTRSLAHATSRAA